LSTGSNLVKIVTLGVTNRLGVTWDLEANVKQWPCKSKTGSRPKSNAIIIHTDPINTINYTDYLYVTAKPHVNGTSSFRGNHIKPGANHPVNHSHKSTSGVGLMYYYVIHRRMRSSTWSCTYGSSLPFNR
jgi:hypothetical protein